jgi:hypothetical protein
MVIVALSRSSKSGNSKMASELKHMAKQKRNDRD